MSELPDRADAVIETLLRQHGRTFSHEIGARVERNTPSPLFRLLCLSLVCSARIKGSIAVEATVALASAGWTTPSKMAASTWADRTSVLNHAGYARYDETTAHYLQRSTELLQERYGGDLRHLRVAADGDRDEVLRLVREFTGIGPVGAGVFLREVQVVWDEFAPFADERPLETAGRLGLPTTAETLFRSVDDLDEFVRLLAALVRVDLTNDVDSVLDATSASTG